MKTIVGLFLTTMISMTAYADLAGEFDARRNQDLQQRIQQGNQVTLRAAYQAVERFAKSKIAGSPEVKGDGPYRLWFFQMKNGLICNIEIDTLPSGWLFAVTNLSLIHI